MTNKEAANILTYQCRNYSMEELHMAFDLAIKALEERPRGRWIPVEPDCRGYTEEFECSNCNNRVKYSYCMKKSEYPICPNCGADMRGGKQ